MKELKDYKYILTKPQISSKAFIAGGVKLIGAVVIARRKQPGRDEGEED